MGSCVKSSPTLTRKMASAAVRGKHRGVAGRVAFFVVNCVRKGPKEHDSRREGRIEYQALRKQRPVYESPKIQPVLLTER